MAHCWSSFPPLVDMDWKYGSDQKMSSFLLFEASGDSEEDFMNHSSYDHDSNNLYSQNLFAKSPGVSVAGQHGGDDGDDDAESCSCDSVDMPVDLQDHDFMINNFNHQVFNITCDRNGDGDGGNNGDDDNILIRDRHLKEFEFSGAVGKNILQPEEGEEESRVGVHGGGGEVVMMDEEERNRLFWETCLQVGLPMNYTQ